MKPPRLVISVFALIFLLTPPTASPVPTADSGPLVEACGGARTAAAEPPAALTCTRWKVEWSQGGKVWGVSTGETMEAVEDERDRQQGFARQYARFFGEAIDPRYASPSAPICDTCKDTTATGRWGSGQKFSGAAARRSVKEAQEKIDALRVALAEHAPNLTAAARLAREPKTARAAEKYAAHLKLALVEVAAAQLAVDNAAVLRAAADAQKAGASVEGRTKELASSLKSLQAAVAKEVARAHGGKYTEDNATGPYLQVKVEQSKVTATYFNGSGASSTWFEGNVGLDGSVTGKSLVAPEKGTLACKEHTEDCGFVYVSSVLRFNERPGPEGKKPREVAELWFQQSQWVQAKPFSRAR